MKRYQVLLTDEQVEYINKLKNDLSMSDSQTIRTIIAKDMKSDYKPEVVFIKYGSATRKIVSQIKRIGNNLNQLTHSFNILMNANIFTQEELRANKRGLEIIKRLDKEQSALLEDMKKRFL